VIVDACYIGGLSNILLYSTGYFFSGSSTYNAPGPDQQMVKGLHWLMEHYLITELCIFSARDADMGSLGSIEKVRDAPISRNSLIFSSLKPYHL
jgi:hypothetical protein